MTDDLDSLLLEGGAFKAEVRACITEAKITRTIDSSPTLQLTINDKNRTILKSGLLKARVTVQFNGFNFELAQVKKSKNKITVTMEDLAVAELRRHNTPYKVAANTMTRVGFVRQLLQTETPWIKLNVDPSVIGTVAQVELSRGTIQTQTSDTADPNYFSGGSASVATSSNNALSTGQIAGAAKAAGFPDADIAMMTAIAKAESGGRPAAVSPPNKNGTTDYGLWQINSVHKQLLASGTWSDPLSNAKMALSVYQGSGGPKGANRFRPWSTYNNGDYKPYLPEARAAAKSPSSDYATSGQGSPDASSLEDSWTCFKRIFNEVNWRLYADHGQLYAGPDSAFINKDPIVTLKEFEGGVNFIDFDFDTGKPVSTVTIDARLDSWACEPGSVMAIPDLGLPIDNWLCSSVTRSIFGKATTIQGTSPQPEIPEPAGTGDTESSYFGEVGSSGTTQGSGQASDGVYVWPVTSRKISSPFGATNGRSHPHQGLDITCPDGTSVVASRAGTVTQADNSDPSGYGNAVYIDHGDGQQTRYGHLSSFTSRRGMTVTQGQEIGKSGHTGDATGPHLHFEIRVNGTPIDPLTKLSNSSLSAFQRLYTGGRTDLKPITPTKITGKPLW